MSLLDVFLVGRSLSQPCPWVSDSLFLKKVLSCFVLEHFWSQPKVCTVMNGKAITTIPLMMAHRPKVLTPLASNSLSPYPYDP